MVQAGVVDLVDGEPSRVVITDLLRLRASRTCGAVKTLSNTTPGTGGISGITCLLDGHVAALGSLPRPRGESGKQPSRSACGLPAATTTELKAVMEAGAFLGDVGDRVDITAARSKPRGLILPACGLILPARR